MVGHDGVQVSQERITAFCDWPTPGKMSEIRSFLRLLQFFRRFVRDFSQVAATLTSLTRKSSGIQNWDSSCDEASARLKSSLCSAHIRAPPEWTSPVAVIPMRCNSRLAVPYDKLTLQVRR